MERFVKGDVVVVPSPFSDLSTVKRRPALVIAAPGGDDVILCQITSQQIRDRYAVGITELDFAEGTLHKPSNIRPNRLFSASVDLILYRAGRLNDRAVMSSSIGSSGSCRRSNCQPGTRGCGLCVPFTFDPRTARL